MASPQEQSSSSVQGFVSAAILNGIFFIFFILLFVILRRKQRRVYEPRTLLNSVPAERKPEPTPNGAFAWVNFLFNKPESWIIQQTGIDGYFFLRYIFFFVSVFLLAGVVILPVLLAVNATNGKKDSQGFDIISYSNVKNKNRIFAHVFCSWLFFGLIIYGIYRELYYYVSFRHAYQTTPLVDSLISTRTLLLTSLPKDLVDDESQIKALFPAASSVTFARDYKQLTKDVKERTKLAGKYEAVLNKVIGKSLKIKNKFVKKNKPLPENPDTLESYIPEKKQPHHKLKPIIGKKVNTIDYANEHLPELNEKIKTQQADYLHANAVGSVFLEFPSQLELQKAYQAVRYYKPFRKSGSKAIINTAPSEIIWDNLSLSNPVRLGKKTVAITVLCLMIIFWAIPVAVVGCISNINYLTEKVHFLRFINNCPKVLLGLITALLPTIALSILMSLIPPFIKLWGKFGGLLTVQQLDLWVQDWYYAFQVIQVFLVATLASAATSVVTSIINNPGSAMTLLAQNLPKASNFYIAYILLQGLTIPGGAMAQIVALILSQFLGKILWNTPRKKWVGFNTLVQPNWGVIYPVYGFISVIAICYTIISPIILVFCVFGLFLVYVAYLYNLVYVVGHSVDNRGRNYPKALFLIFVALYLAELCLIGLFVLAKSWGPFGLEIAFLVFTIIAHLYLKYRFIPLYDQIPLSGIYDAAGNESYQYPIKDQGLKEIKATGKGYWDGSSNTSNFATSLEGKGSNDAEGTVNSTEGKSSHEGNGRVQASLVGTAAEAPRSKPNAGSIARWFKPTSHLSFPQVRKYLPVFLNEPVRYTDAQYQANQYLNPAVIDPEPTIWVPRDDLGLSRSLIARSNGLLVSDENTIYNEKGKPEVTGPPPDYEEAIKV